MREASRAEFVAGSPVYVDDREIGRLEQIIYSPAQRKVVGLVVGKGLVFHEDVVVPVDLIMEASEEGIRMALPGEGLGKFQPYRQGEFVQPPEQWPVPEGLPRRKILFAIPGLHSGMLRVSEGELPDEAGGAVTISAKTRVVSYAGALGHVALVMVDGTTGQATHVVVHSSPVLGRSVIVPLDWASRVTAEEIFVEADKDQLAHLPEYRTDQEILSDVWEALWSIYPIRTMGLESIEVEVKDGVVTLKGNVASPSHRYLAMQAVSKLRGVLQVVDRLIADDDLAAAVARELAQDEQLARLFIKVQSELGLVTLEGTVPSEDLRQRALHLAERVHGVKGVVSRLHVAQ
jgi:osmotically-inducible protein OsmY